MQKTNTIKIHKGRRFFGLPVDDFGKITLFVGDVGVGKTLILEKIKWDLRMPGKIETASTETIESCNKKDKAKHPKWRFFDPLVGPWPGGNAGKIGMEINDFIEGLKTCPTKIIATTNDVRLLEHVPKKDVWCITRLKNTTYAARSSNDPRYY